MMDFGQSLAFWFVRLVAGSVALGVILTLGFLAIQVLWDRWRP